VGLACADRVLSGPEYILAESSCATETVISFALGFAPRDLLSSESRQKQIPNPRMSPESICGP